MEKFVGIDGKEHVLVDLEEAENVWREDSKKAKKLLDDYVMNFEPKWEDYEKGFTGFMILNATLKSVEKIIKRDKENPLEPVKLEVLKYIRRIIKRKIKEMKDSQIVVWDGEKNPPLIVCSDTEQAKETYGDKIVGKLEYNVEKDIRFGDLFFYNGKETGEDGFGIVKIIGLDYRPDYKSVDAMFTKWSDSEGKRIVAFTSELKFKAFMDD